jgi:asparagine synthase (glutamine-hydrolysing)
VCGIAGFELRGGDEEVAQRLLRRLAPRGPDASWYVTAGPYGLVQTRLSVIDLSDRVRYPLRSEDGDLYLLFNGEIYDYESHRRELSRRDHRFSTACDAEVVLHGYEEWGVDVFRRLDGIFAAALFHAGARELVLTRDAVGVKPLVYTTGDQFAFSSDALSLVAAGLSEGTIDESAMGSYLSFRYLLPPATGLSDVIQVAPGEALRRNADGTLSKERWRSRPFGRPAALAHISVEEAEAAIDASVRRQLVADVPVGVFLSSGLDSSLVLDSAVRAGVRPVAFTIGFAGHGDYDEAAGAARLAREYGVSHVVGELSGGFVDTIGLIGDAFDQPFADPSAIATVQLARLARKRVTVALSGTGGDDLFAGYYRHRVYVLAPVAGRIPAAAQRLLRATAPEPGAERHSMATLTRSYMARLAEIRTDDPLTLYLGLVGSAVSQPALAVVRHGWTAAPDPVALRNRLNNTTGSVLRQIQAFEFETYVPGDLLQKEDRATMAFGLEARVPLLDARMVELAEQTSDRLKAGLRSGKRLLRAVAERRMPRFVTRARKRGFAVPLTAMFAGPWRMEAIEWFTDSRSALVDGDMAARLLHARQLPATDAWTLAALMAWEASVSAARRGL